MICPVCNTNELTGKQKTCSTACRVKLTRMHDKATEGIVVSASDQPPEFSEPELKKAIAVAVVKDLGYTLIPITQLPKTTFIPTGFKELDTMIKGIPRKRITEIYGPASTGKTTMLLTMIAGFPLETKTLYLDLENAIDAEWSQSLGLTSVNTTLGNPILLEDAAQLVLDSITQYDLIVFDSVASALYKTEETNDFGSANIGIKAKLMTQLMRKLIGPLSRTNCAVVFINQEKPSIGDMYAPKWYVPGGKALEYAASMRLRLTSNKADRVIKDGQNIGKKVNVEVTKNKVGRPYQTATFPIRYA